MSAGRDVMSTRGRSSGNEPRKVLTELDVPRLMKEVPGLGQPGRQGLPRDRLRFGQMEDGALDQGAGILLCERRRGESDGQSCPQPEGQHSASVQHVISSKTHVFTGQSQEITVGAEGVIIRADLVALHPRHP